MPDPVVELERVGGSRHGSRARALGATGAVVAVLALVVAVGLTGEPGATPGGSLSAATGPASQDPGDAATARSLVEHFEAAGAAGDGATAWSLLARWSPRQFPSVQSFADTRSRLFAAAGNAYVIGQPRRDDPFVPAWLAKSNPGVLDPGRVFSVEVTHPNASLPADKLEVFIVGLDASVAWKIWILN